MPARYLSRKAKGQTSFEAIIILCLVLAICTAFFLDASEASIDSTIYSAIKSTVESKTAILALSSPCADSHLRWMNATQKIILLNFSGCVPSLPQAANTVEQQVCSSVPNNDNYVDCGTDRYFVGVSA